ncbi:MULTISPECIES: hypothetical protein [unclassified Spirillospora]|uniref:hypothetical protein n=1 Tax=unclassified Spirillospora TaxID=2642701 RepID=UPI0037121A55
MVVVNGYGVSADATFERLDVLVRLMTDLRGLGRGSWLALPVAGQPVLYVQARSGRLAVLGVQDRGGWSYMWDGGRKAAADGTLVAARQIAGVAR